MCGVFCFVLFSPGIYSNMEEKERQKRRASVSSHRWHHSRVVGAAAGEGSLLVGYLSNVREDAALLTLIHLQIKTGKTGHPSVPRRMARILQFLPSAGSALSDFVLIYFLPLAVVAPLPSVHWCKKEHVVLSLPDIQEQEEDGRRSREIFTVFILCGVCWTLECRKIINKQIWEEITYFIILVGDKPVAIYQVSTRNKCLLSFSHF